MIYASMPIIPNANLVPRLFPLVEERPWWMLVMGPTENCSPRMEKGDGKVSYNTCFHFCTSHFNCNEWPFCTIIFENHIYFKILAKLYRML
jgi:hypothetical protein